MKVILIEEDSFADVCDLMQKQVLEAALNYPQYRPTGVDLETWKKAMEQAHRTMHFTFVRWAQGHGASCVR